MSAQQLNYLVFKGNHCNNINDYAQYINNQCTHFWFGVPLVFIKCT